jgi:hypothetical protein
MPVTRDSATPEQVANFVIANGSAIRALNHAILVLEALPAQVPFEQRAEVELHRANAVAQRAILQAEYLAFMSEQGQIEPPDATVVSQVEQIAADLDQMTANATALVGLVNGITNLINAYRGAAAPAGATPAGATPAGATAAGETRGLGRATAMASADNDARRSATTALIDAFRQIAAASRPRSTSKKKKLPRGGKGKGGKKK